MAGGGPQGTVLGMFLFIMEDRKLIVRLLIFCLPEIQSRSSKATLVHPYPDQLNLRSYR